MSDRIFGLVIVVTALAYMVSAVQISTSFLVDPLGPKFFPLLIGGLMGVAGLVVFLRPADSPTWFDRDGAKRMAITLATLFIYVYVLKPGGFLLPTAVMGAILSYQISPSLRQALITGCGLSAGLFVILRFALGLGITAFPAFF